MAVLPIIPNTYRVTLLWGANLGIACRNTFHVNKAGTTLAAIWGNLDTAFGAPALAASQWQACGVGFGCQTALVYDLGTTNAGEVRTLTRGLVGGGANDVIPGASPIITIRSSQRGPQGRGRLYLPPVTEDQQAGGKLTAGALTTMGAAWATFLGSLAGNGVAFGMASYKHAAFHPFTSVVVESALATRRPRQNKIRGA